MGNGTLFLCAAGLIAAFALLIWDSRRHQHELLQMERMRSSPLYYEIYPLVLHARRFTLDRVLVERDRVIFFSMRPPGKIGEFSIVENGFRPLTKERVRALALVLAEDMPALRENAHYRLKKYRVTRPNGIRDDGYLYIMRTAYKTTLMLKRQRARLY